ncbi:MAG: DUF445 family protein [Paenibacillaceae bacterium]|nr:DUF445 family protein [Paenibacillaceae bacterium]
MHRVIATAMLCLFATVYSILWMIGDVSVVLMRALEAGLIGGIADWFAVTALTRHPLGIRVPHTALLVTRKKDIVRSLSTLVDTLLDHQAIRADITARLPGVLDAFAQAVTVPTSAVRVHVTDFLRTLAPAVGYAAQTVITSWEKNPPPIDAGMIVRAIHGWIDQPERARLFGSWAMQMTVHIPPMLRMLLQPLLDEQKIGTWVQRMLRDATSDTKAASWEPHVHACIAHLIAHMPDPAARAAAAWNDALEQQYVYDALAHIARTTIDNTHTMDKLNAFVDGLLAHILAHVRPWIERGFAQRAAQYPDKAWIALVEQHISRDIQWIRINGTVCGALLGTVFGVLELLH